MATVLGRRTVAVAAVAAMATTGSPFLGSAGAAAFAATAITTQPAPDSGVVYANRPTIKASFNDNLASSSTIDLTVKGQSSNLCSSFQVSGKDVTCTPTQDLSTTKTYVAVGHGVSNGGAKASTDKLEFTVSYPVFQGDQSYPVPGGSIIAGNESITAQFDQAITGNDSDTFAADGAFKVFEVNPDGTRGTQLPGAISFGGDPVQGSDGTVSFKLNGVANGQYEAAVLVYGVDDNGHKNPAALGTANYYFWVDNNPPSGLTSPAIANNVTAPEFPFTGTAAPGLTVTVTVPDSSVPGHLNDASGEGVVPTCGQALCEWTVTVDISGLPDNNNQSWSAQTSDDVSSTKPTAAGPPFAIDQSAPNEPNVTDPTISSDSTHVNVSATHDSADTDVVSYHITITDEEGNSVETDASAVGQNLPQQSIDVTTLDDGTLSVLVQAEDAAGNRSDPPSDPPFGSGTPTVEKHQGLFPNIGTSTFTEHGTDVSFTDAEDGVKAPSSVTLRFTQPIKLSYTDNTKAPPKTYNSSICVATTAGNCVTSGAPKLSDDGRGLVLDINNTLADRTYQLKATTFSKNDCPNVNPGSTDHCTPAEKNAYTGLVIDPATGQPFQFTVDSTPPTVDVTSINPRPITYDSVTNVSISGTVSPDAESVQLTIRSDGGSGTRLATATITPPSTPGADATWSASGLDLSGFADGRLTVRAKAVDAAGNKGVGRGHVALKAHPSKLTETVDHSKVTIGKVVSVSGRLTDPNHDGIVSATITVQARYAGGKLGVPTTATTDSKGRWSVLQAPTHNATFVATYAGSKSQPVHAPATTDSASTKVRAKVLITSPDDGSTGSRPTIKGKVKPNEKGQLVTVYRKTSHGKQELGTDRLGKRSTFSVEVHLPTGTSRVFAQVGKTSSNLGGRSAVVTLQVG